jgi:general secretion pathway protein K
MPTSKSYPRSSALIRGPYVLASREKGGALLAVLWLSAALAAIAFSVATTVRSETDRVSSSADGLRASYLATGSVERAIQWMMWGPEVRNPDGTPRWQPNQPRMMMSFPSGDAVVELIPESSKFNINTASLDDLMRVVTIVTGDPQRASQIVAGIVASRTGSGGASPFTLNSFNGAPTFQPLNTSFREIEELLLVPGITPEVFYGNYIPSGDPNARMLATGGLRDCLSVWGSNGPFDANTASPALMESIGVPPPAVEAIVARRTSQPFKNLGEVSGLGASTSRLGIGGNLIWTLRATARLRRPDGSPSEVVRTAAAVVKLLDPANYMLNPVHILRWYEDAWSQSAIVPPMNLPVLPPPPTNLLGAPLQ